MKRPQPPKSLGLVAMFAALLAAGCGTTRDRYTAGGAAGGSAIGAIIGHNTVCGEPYYQM